MDASPFRPRAGTTGASRRSTEKLSQLAGNRSALFTNVRFSVRAYTTFGQSVRVVGDCPSLGCWQATHSIFLTTDENQFPLWTGTVRMPTDIVIEYKYVLQSGNSIEWESTPANRTLLVEGVEVHVDDGDFGILRTDEERAKVIHDPLSGLLVGRPSEGDLVRRPSASASMSSSVAPMEDVVSSSSSVLGSEMSARRDNRLITVMYRLPLRSHRDPETNKVEFSLDDDALYYTYPGLRSGLAGKYKARWVGIIDDIVVTDPVEQKQIEAELLERFDFVPVWVDGELRAKYYAGFCKEVLWPPFHHVVDLGDSVKQFDPEWWRAYCQVNNLFAQTIGERHHGELVWIHDYHLMLLPLYLRRRISFHRASIGFFLHTPFPSSEVYRLLPIRNELLHGVLNASLIGFQMYEYARHFLACCKRLLGLEFNSRRGGFLGLEYGGRQVMVRISHLGIDPERCVARMEDIHVVEQVKNLSQKFKGAIVMLGIDNLERLKGVSLKFLAIERLLRDYPKYRGRLVLVQCCMPRYTVDAGPLSKELKSLAERINDTYGNPTTGYLPISYSEQELSFDDRVSLYAIADGVLITSIRDGLNLVPYEYLMCNHRAGVVIVSEFMGCSRSLQGAIRVNPWSVDDVLTAIDTGLSLKESERRSKFEKDRQHVATRTTTEWALNFLKDLEVAENPRSPVTFLGLGLSLSFRTLEFSPGFKALEFATVLKAYQSTRNRVLLFDYEGTISRDPITLPQLSAPSLDLLKSLSFLCNDVKNTVYVLSGRQRHFLNKWFDVERLGLIAEHGMYYQQTDSSEWTQVLQGVDLSWMEIVRQILHVYCERTDGSYLEAKDSSMVWRYGEADPEFGAMQAKELQDHLLSVLGNFEVQISHGKGLLEVSPKGINKGVVVDHLLTDLADRHLAEPDFVLCLGDSRSDEDMFALLDTRYPSSRDRSKRGPVIFTCTVGRKPSHAHYYLTDVEEAVELLQALRFSSAKSNRVQSSLELRNLPSRHSSGLPRGW